MADPSDVGDLRAELAHGVLVSEVHVERYEHMDFTWGRDVTSTLYGQLTEELMKVRMREREAFQQDRSGERLNVVG